MVTFGPGSADRTGGGGGQGDAGSRVCPAVEEHIFDVGWRIEVFFVLGKLSKYSFEKTKLS